MATSSKADISETERFFGIFYCAYEIYVKLGQFVNTLTSDYKYSR